MIIEGFEVSSKGNSVVRVSNDNRTESFTLITHVNLPKTHTLKHLHLWQLRDEQKNDIAVEIRSYIKLHGDDRQKRIVFGERPGVWNRARYINGNRL